MTTSNDPEVLRAEIEQTRARLSQDVNALGEAVAPSTIAKRQVDKAKGAAVGLKDKVMGQAEDAGHSVTSSVADKASGLTDRAGSLTSHLPGIPGSGGGSGGSGGSGGGMMSGVTDQLSSVGGTVGGTVGAAPDMAKSRAKGNPLAAGMIAVGAGWLLGSLLPASNKERQALTTLKQQAKPLVGQAQTVAQSVAKDAAQSLKEPALEAADSVKSTAQGAVQQVKSEGQQQAQAVKGSAQEFKENVQQHQSDPRTSM